MNKVYNSNLYVCSDEMLVINNNVPEYVQPGETLKYGWTLDFTLDGDTTENTRKVPVFFGSPIAYYDESDPLSRFADKTPLNLFTRIYYVKPKEDTQEMTVYFFVKNFTEEEICFNVVYFPVVCTEFRLTQ